VRGHAPTAARRQDLAKKQPACNSAFALDVGARLSVACDFMDRIKRLAAGVTAASALSLVGFSLPAGATTVQGGDYGGGGYSEHHNYGNHHHQKCFKWVWHHGYKKHGHWHKGYWEKVRAKCHHKHHQHHSSYDPNRHDGKDYGGWYEVRFHDGKWRVCK
jgi:hypothetical protein